MTTEELDEAYTLLCQQVARAGEPQAALYLARLAVLLILECDPERVKAAIASAAVV